MEKISIMNQKYESKLKTIYYSAIAKTTEEVQRLIEDGLSLVCITPQNIRILRKPK